MNLMRRNEITINSLSIIVKVTIHDLYPPLFVNKIFCLHVASPRIHAHCTCVITIIVETKLDLAVSPPTGGLGSPVECISTYTQCTSIVLHVCKVKVTTTLPQYIKCIQYMYPQCYTHMNMFCT